MIGIIFFVAIISLGIYFAFGLILLIGILKIEMIVQTKQQPVSVIICAKNELKNLKRLLPKLTAQTHDDFEVIIVDDKSEDGTYDFMLEYPSDRVRLIRIDNTPDHIDAKKYAITMGVKAAANEILLFTDADCVPVSNLWIHAMTRPFKKGVDFVLGVSQYQVANSLLNGFIRYEALQTAINYIGFAAVGNPYMCVGRNLAYRKSVFLAYKGFYKTRHIRGGDDDLLINRLANKKNTKIAIGLEAMTLSIPNDRWRDYFYQKIRHISVSKFYKPKDKMLLGIQATANVLFWIALAILATQSGQVLIALELLLIRIIFSMMMNHILSKKFGIRICIWLVPIMDVLYLFYVAIIGPVGLFTKRVRWKK